MATAHALNVHAMTPLPAPRTVKAALPLTAAAERTVATGRAAVQRILAQDDPRLLVIVGPCSIHDPEAALDYASRLNALRAELDDRLCLVMRVYFEKPRTTVGWKGLLYDPELDGSEDLAVGLRLARQLLLHINAMGLPAGTEMLDLVMPQYHADLITWAAIGARTSESQTHREMASGLPMPVGFKNTTEGNVQIAINAVASARRPHTFPSLNQDGQVCMVRTTGNPWGHVVLRGGSGGPNYEAAHLAQATAALQRGGHTPVLMVDCSHANANKQHDQQEAVWEALVAQRVAGNRHLVGMMLESNIGAGSQTIAADRSQMRYGVSVTDPCVDWETTARMLRQAHATLGAVL